MTPKRVTINAVGPGLRLAAATGSGHTVMFDDEQGDFAARPTEVLLAALGACTAMDVLSILRKKRQPLAGYRVRVEGDQRDEYPRIFTDIRVVHEIDGAGVDPLAIRRAVELSATRYCTISGMLASGATRINHWFVLRGSTPGDAEVKEVIVTGPFTEPTTTIHAEVAASPGAEGPAPILT